LSGVTYRTGLKGLNEIRPGESPRWIVDFGPVSDFPANAVIAVKIVGFHPAEVFVPNVNEREAGFQGRNGEGFVRIVPQTKEQRVDALMQLATDWIQTWEHRPMEAEQKVREALALDENNGRVWGALGFILNMSGQPEEAIRAYERAAALTNSPSSREDYLHIVKKGPRLFGPLPQWPSDVPAVGR